MWAYGAQALILGPTWGQMAVYLNEGVRDVGCVRWVVTGPLEGSHAFQEVQSPLSYCPCSSLPVEVLRWVAERLAHLCPARRGGQGGTPPLPLEVRLDALGAVVLDGLSYRRAARMVEICKTEVGDSLDLLLGELAALGCASPTGRSWPPSQTCANGWRR